jgi:aldehyde dehydrogenase (NAD+)
MTAPNIPEIVAGLRATFDRGHTRPLQWRMGQLRALERMVNENSDAIVSALQADLGKPSFEAWAAEIGVALRDVKEMMKHVSGWMRTERVGAPLIVQPGKGEIYKDPLGVVLIISAWNYPFNLAIAPMLGAIAAGNAVIIKPSEVASHTSAVIARLMGDYLDTEAIRVVEGGIPETTTLLGERFDHILYTGNGTVGRIVMTAAAKYLTPVTLELGGKSPCYVHRSADLKTTCRRIAWGKFTNAGQTCIAPDYILVDETIHDQFIEQMVKTLHQFYGDDPQQGQRLCRIINERHHDRLMRLIDSGDAVIGGTGDRDDRYIAPTVLTNVSPDSPVMSEEIFGPILPVLKVGSVDDAVTFVNARPKPLALYIFTGDDHVAKQILSRTSSGGATVNHTMLHFAVSDLPFGGVGESGMGAYHGRASFDTFTHRKSVLKKPFMIDPSIMYPPYDDSKEKWIKRLL